MRGAACGRLRLKARWWWKAPGRKKPVSRVDGGLGRVERSRRPQFPAERGSATKGVGTSRDWRTLRVNLGAGVPPARGEPRGLPLREDVGSKPASFGGAAGASSFLKRAKEARDGGTPMCLGSVDTAENQHPCRGIGQKVRASRGPGRKRVEEGRRFGQERPSTFHETRATKPRLTGSTRDRRAPPGAGHDLRADAGGRRRR